MIIHTAANVNVLKPCPGQEVNLVASNSRVVGRGMVMEDNKLHSHEISSSFLKVAITKINNNIAPLLRTTFDDPYLTVGDSLLGQHVNVLQLFLQTDHN